MAVSKAPTMTRIRIHQGIGRNCASGDGPIDLKRGSLVISDIARLPWRRGPQAHAEGIRCGQCQCSEYVCPCVFTPLRRDAGRTCPPPRRSRAFLLGAGADGAAAGCASGTGVGAWSAALYTKGGTGAGCASPFLATPGVAAGSGARPSLTASGKSLPFGSLGGQPQGSFSWSTTSFRLPCWNITRCPGCTRYAPPSKTLETSTYGAFTPALSMHVSP